ncbi:hypothetical protein O181_111887 [Austropuccinia psidii MF-1]|uniref:Uncharacterized protein n=1 Tax=Austropuccinia psidii MF-1 TaxID=1389203 RepID=A0A9Q3K0Q8_9BASI|nr:hypothetical protein [Austropuccinia psidii MF-1]
MSCSDHSYGSGYCNLIKAFTANEIKELLFGSALPSFAETLSNLSYPPQSPPALDPLSRAPSVSSDTESVPEAAGRGTAAFPERRCQSLTIYVPETLRDALSPHIRPYRNFPLGCGRMLVLHFH